MMPTSDLVILIPLYTGAVVVVLRELFDGFSRRPRRNAEHQQVVSLLADTSSDLTAQLADVKQQTVDASHEVVSLVGDVKQQTNGSLDRMQKTVVAQSIEIGRLQGMVQGLQTQRRLGRATDAAPSGQDSGN